MKKITYKQAVEAKCRQCIYDPHQPGTWRRQVAECPCVSCSLHPVRPVPRNWHASNGRGQGASSGTPPAGG